MNISKSLPFTNALWRLWARFNIWRAKRMYRRLGSEWERLTVLKARADKIIRRYAEDPQTRLPLGDDD